MSSWRIAESLLTLRKQIDAASPGRSKASDGAIGDAQHASRNSDHNPWVTDAKIGVVTAIDITHDPRAGVDANAITDALKASGDGRIKYLIWNRQIWNPSVSAKWRPYTGSNPHNKHFHISVKPGKALYDNASAWQIGDGKPDDAAPAIAELPALREGVTGQEAAVARVKAVLFKELESESGFGPMLYGLVRGFQRKHGLGEDGKVGPYTWDAIN